MINTDKYCVYDAETLSNFISFVFKNHQTGMKKKFVIWSEQNDVKPLMKFLKGLYQEGWTLVGFNCNGFDAQILEYIIKHYHDFKYYDGEQLARKIYEKAQWIINLPQDERFLHLIPEWEFHIPHIDIYRQKHYDGKGKNCSLKWLEFTMRFENIESMPFPHYHEVIFDQVDDILRYNENDVDATDAAFTLFKFETDLRITLSEKYARNLLNASEPRLAREIFGQILADEMGIPYRELRERRTHRNLITPSEFIFKYLKFYDPLLKAAKDFYMRLQFNPYNTESNNLNLKKIEKVFRFHNIPEVVIGLGGIHGCVNSGVYKSTDKHEIRDIDVSSFYPNLGIENNLYPEHLSEHFCKVYKDLYLLRKTIPKDDPVNLVIKIILNSTYGLSKEPNNYFHDPKYTYSITINGQLSLLMLAEILKAKVPGLIFYQINTDGVTVGYDPIHKKKVSECMKIWEKITKLALEEKFYTTMVIKDVNNYMAVDTEDKIKRKGLFAYSLNPKDRELEYHKNTSALIIPKALEAFFIHGVDYSDFIQDGKDIYDFCKGVKVRKDFDLWMFTYNKKKNQIDKEIVDQSVVRYYVSHEPVMIKKKYRDGSKFRTGKKGAGVVDIDKGWNITYFNKYVKKEMKDYGINYEHYIAKTREIIDDIQPHRTQGVLNF